eukprot:jgi/Tetstr1/426975/TSEL_017188.t1
MRDVLRLFWACYATAPSTTAGTFVPPASVEAPWWRLTGGEQVIAYFRRGHTLFTSPEWRDASRTNLVPSLRVYRGPTTRGVVRIHVLPAGPMNNLSAQATRAMPRLSGDWPRDLLRLRQLQDGFWRRLLMGADGLEDLRLRSSTTDTYRSSPRNYCSFCAERGATPLPATLGLLRGCIYHCTSDRSLAPSTIAGRLAAISDWHMRQLPHLRLAGCPTLQPVQGREHQHPRLYLGAPDRTSACASPPLTSGASAAALICDFRVSTSGAMSYTDLSAVRVLFNAELGCRYIRLRMDVDKNIDARHECFTYIPATCLAWLSARLTCMLEDYLCVFRPPSGSRLLAAPKSSRIGPQTFHTTLYSGSNSACKAAYARAFPDPATRTTPLDRVSSHSGRKSLAQWLWDRYRSAPVIAHVGHWA